jgi:hypothetical protein
MISSSDKFHRYSLCLLLLLCVYMCVFVADLTDRVDNREEGRAKVLEAVEDMPLVLA